jgi:hypothetical protein
VSSPRSSVSGLQRIIETGEPDAVGGILRSLTFVGEDDGANHAARVRTDARPWTEGAKAEFYREHISSRPEKGAADVQAGSGFSYAVGSMAVDVFWFPGEDGVLYFRVMQGDRVLRRVATWHASAGSGWEDVTAHEAVMESTDPYNPSAPAALLSHLRPASVVHQASRLAKRFESEPYWQAEAVIVGALALNVGLTKKLAIGPVWLMPALELLLLLTLVATAPARRQHQGQPPYPRTAPRAALILVAAVNNWSLGLLVHELLKGTNAGGRPLILAAVVIWLTNVIVFALAFWELDRGGPNARAEADREGPPDFLFVEMTTQDVLGTGFRPSFVDYLYLAYTNATAFSPTDTMPLGAVPKLMMFIQSLASLVTVGLVASRAVNILK